MLDHVHGALHVAPGERDAGTAVRRGRQPRAADAPRVHSWVRRADQARQRGDRARHPARARAGSSPRPRRMTMLVEDLLLLARLDAGRPLQFEQTDLVPLVVDTVSDARAAGRTTTGGSTCPTSPRSCPPTRHGFSRSSSTCWQRPHAHPARYDRHRARPAARAVDVRGRRRTTGRASRRTCCRTCSNGSREATRRAPAPSGSTGLGLAIVQAVATAHGGAVTVDSVPGRTVFTVHLPALGPAVPPLVRARNKPAIGLTGTAQCQHMGVTGRLDESRCHANRLFSRHPAGAGAPPGRTTPVRLSWT